MKITRRQLRQIIKEEMSRTLLEGAKTYKSIVEFIKDPAGAKEVHTVHRITIEDILEYWSKKPELLRTKHGSDEKTIMRAMGSSLPGKIKGNEYIVVDRSEIPKPDRASRETMAKKYGLDTTSGLSSGYQFTIKGHDITVIISKKNLPPQYNVHLSAGDGAHK